MPVDNATITLTRGTKAMNSDTGYLEESDEDDVTLLVEDAPCFFHPSRASRRVYSNGQRQMVKLVPIVTLDSEPGVEPRVGDTALVTIADEDPVEYTVGHCFVLPSVARRQWYIELEATLSPA